MKVLRKKLQFRPLYWVIICLILSPFVVNCSREPATGNLPEEALSPAAEKSGMEDLPLVLAAFNAGSDTLWADASGQISPRSAPSTSSSRISLDVRDANILDVLTMLAIKMGAQVIFLEQPTLVTFKSSNLSALTTFQLLLQKEKLDYLVVAGHYVVGNRERLYDDFYNRMILTRYSVQYISAQKLTDLIGQLNIPVQNVTVDVNTQEIWVQGTPMALGKFLELIAAVDRRQNAEFATGGTRVVRMPVAQASGEDATLVLSALAAQQKLLEDLISNSFTPPVVSGGAPRISQLELFWKVSDNISADPDNPTFILWVEGTPDHIELVRKMIEEISVIESP